MNSFTSKHVTALVIVTTTSQVSNKKGAIWIFCLYLYILLIILLLGVHAILVFYNYINYL